MVGHVSVLEQVDADFSGARRRALLRRMAARLRGNTASGGLLSASMMPEKPPGRWRGFNEVRGRCRWGRFAAASVDVRSSTEPLCRSRRRGESVEAGGPGFPAKRGATRHQPLQGRRFLLRSRWPPPHLGSPLPRRRVDRGRSDGSPRRSTERPKDQRVRTGVAEGGETSMREMMDLQLARQRREELLREAETHGRAEALRAARGRRVGRDQPWRGRR